MIYMDWGIDPKPKEIQKMTTKEKVAILKAQNEILAKNLAVYASLKNIKRDTL